jgi:hypothetical protein
LRVLAILLTGLRNSWIFTCALLLFCFVCSCYPPYWAKEIFDFDMCSVAALLCVLAILLTGLRNSWILTCALLLFCCLLLLLAVVVVRECVYVFVTP